MVAWKLQLRGKGSKTLGFQLYAPSNNGLDDPAKLLRWSKGSLEYVWVADAILRVRKDCRPTAPACQLSFGSRNRGSICAVASPGLAIEGVDLEKSNG